MRSISPQVITQLQASELRPFLLHSFDLDSTRYLLTDADVDLWVGKMTYTAWPIDAQPVSYSMSKAVDRVRVVLDNTDQTYSTAFISGTPQGGDYHLMGVWLNSSYAPVANPMTLFFGTIDTWSMDEQQIKITITSELYAWDQSTTYAHSPSCRWKVFKGTECAYAGAESWCDRSYTRCEALGNTAYFGGFRWVPSLEDRTIWWGRTSKVD